MLSASRPHFQRLAYGDSDGIRSGVPDAQHHGCIAGWNARRHADGGLEKSGGTWGRDGVNDFRGFAAHRNAHGTGGEGETNSTGIARLARVAEVLFSEVGTFSSGGKPAKDEDDFARFSSKILISAPGAAVVRLGSLTLLIIGPVTGGAVLTGLSCARTSPPG